MSAGTVEQESHNSVREKASFAEEAPTPVQETQIPELGDKQLLQSLEQEAKYNGISGEELDEIRSIGDCPEQIQQRIQELETWLTRH